MCAFVGDAKEMFITELLPVIILQRVTRVRRDLVDTPPLYNPKKSTLSLSHGRQRRDPINWSMRSCNFIMDNLLAEGKAEDYDHRNREQSGRFTATILSMPTLHST